MRRKKKGNKQACVIAMALCLGISMVGCGSTVDETTSETTSVESVASSEMAEQESTEVATQESTETATEESTETATEESIDTTRSDSFTVDDINPNAMAIEPNGDALAGKVVAFDGGTGDIGQVISFELASQGATIVYLTHNENQAKVLLSQIEEKYGVTGGYMGCNISDEDAVIDMVQEVVTDYGSLDILISNAGLVPGEDEYPEASIADMTADELTDITDTHINGYFYCMKYGIQQMMNQEGGVIINTAFQGLHDCQAEDGAYYASKAAEEALTQTAALENTDNGIRLYMTYAEGEVEDETKAAETIADLCLDSSDVASGTSVDVNE